MNFRTRHLRLIHRHGADVARDGAEEADVYINGVRALAAPGWSESYAVFPISPESAAALHRGDNVLAIHVHHADFEGHFIDAGIVEVQWPEAEKGL